MNTLEKAQLKTKVELQIQELEKQIEILKEKTKPISPDCGLGRLTRLEAMGESHVNHKILDESQLRLTRLKNALLHMKVTLHNLRHIYDISTLQNMWSRALTNSTVVS